MSDPRLDEFHKIVSAEIRRLPIKLMWTCCDNCHTLHRNRAAAFVHWCWLRMRGAA